MRLDAHNLLALYGLIHSGGNLSDEPLKRFAHQSPGKRGRERYGLSVGGVRFHGISLMPAELQWNPANT